MVGHIFFSFYYYFFVCPRHLRYRGRGKKWLENVNAGMTISPGGLPYYYYYCMHRCSNERDRASWHCTIGGSCLSSPTSTNLCEWKSGFRLASSDTCDASSMTQTSNVRRANSAELLTPRQVVATTSWTYTRKHAGTSPRSQECEPKVFLT